jgi:hypothetical protein
VGKVDDQPLIASGRDFLSLSLAELAGRPQREISPDGQES